MRKICFGLLLAIISPWATSLVITIDKPAPNSEIPKGTLIPIQFTVKNHPRESSIAFFLRKNVPVRELPDTPGPDGALMLVSQELAEYPIGYFNWSGDSFACAPNDVPQLCTLAVEPGSYRLEAIVYSASNVNLAPTKDAKFPSVLGRVLSAPIQITGEVNNLHAQENLWRGAVRALASKFKLDAPAGLDWSWLIEKDGALVKGEASDEYCQRFSIKPPLEGKLSVCGENKPRSNRTKAGGKVQYQSGQMEYEKAKELARRTAETPYMSRVDYRERVANSPGSTFIDLKVLDWAYRSDNRYWAFVFQLKKGGGNALTRDQFDDTVYVRVDADGKACIGLLYATGSTGELRIRDQGLGCRQFVFPSGPAS